MTDYKTFFEQAVKTLAEIDDALGIGDDGCSDPSITLSEIHDLKERAKRGEDLARAVMADQAYIESGPAWRDAPSAAGVWISIEPTGQFDWHRVRNPIDPVLDQTWNDGSRYFGPIPPDSGETE